MSRPTGRTLAEFLLALFFGGYGTWIAGFVATNARAQSQENAAIAALRSIASAQAQFESLVAVDSDNDGVGEFGYIGELAGTAPLRVYDVVADAPALDANGRTLDPALLPSEFSNLILHPQSLETELEYRGYRFMMFLPGEQPRTGPAGFVPGVPETGATGLGGYGSGYFPDADGCECLWGCYAWPTDLSRGGERAFFMNQDGRLLHTQNNPHSPRTRRVYEGPAGGPAFDAALSNTPRLPSGLTGMAAELGAPPRRANDGNLWTPLGR